MDKQKVNNSNSREMMIVAFVLISSLLVAIDVGKNLTDEIHITSELKTLSTKLEKPQPKIEQTLSDEEMERWGERLKENHSG